MNDRAEKVMAGIFVLVSIVLLTGVLILVAGLRVFENSECYFIRFNESVTGLEESSVVRYQGVPVGRVASIGFARDEFPVIEVGIELEPGTPIKADTTATLKPQGITGIYYIDLGGGSPEAAALAEYGTIEAGESLTVQVMETLSDLGSVVKNLNELIVSNKDEISGLVADVRTVVRAGGDSLKELDKALSGATELTHALREKLEGMMDSAQTSLEAVEAFVSNPATQAIPGKVDEFIDRANRVAAIAEERVSEVDLQGLITQAESALLRVEQIADETREIIMGVKVGVLENRGAVTRMLADLDTFARDLKILVREVRDQPSRLFFGRPRAGRKDSQ